MATADLIWSLLFATAVINGLLLGLALLSRSKSLTSRLMGLLSLVFCLLIGEELVDVLDLYESLPHAMLSSSPLPLAIGPLVYLIVLRITGQPSPRYRLAHFLPVVLGYIYLSPFLLLSSAEKLDQWSASTSMAVTVMVVVKLVHLLAYLGMAHHLIREEGRHDALIEKWLQTWLSVALVLVAVIHIWHFVPPESDGGLDSDKLGSLMMAFFTYGLGLLIFLRPSVLEASDGPEKKRYSTSRLSENELKILAARLETYFEESEAYRDPSLGLEAVADSVGVSTHTLSQILSEAFDMNFYRFVNRKRVEAFQKDLSAGARKGPKLLSVAMDAGFNSKSSFNRVFKSETGMTPSAYRDSIRKEGP